MTDLRQRRRAVRALESLHSMVYFVPEAEVELVGAGLRPGRMTYFAQRVAPLGAVGAGVVAATFYNFNPEIIARHIPRAWTLAAPDVVVQARLRGADLALRRLLGRDLIDGPEVAELADLAKAATAGCVPEGRPLYAGTSDLPWPTEPHLVLWHAATLLREHRGDGHIAALVGADIPGIEALISHCATGHGFLPQAAQRIRGWSDEQWLAGTKSLQDKGVLDEAGALTKVGIQLRATVEDATDRSDSGPWTALGPDGTARLIELGRTLSRAVVNAGAFPPDTFAQL